MLLPGVVAGVRHPGARKPLKAVAAALDTRRPQKTRSLTKAAEACRAGERRTDRLKDLVQAELASEPLADVDYVDCYSFPELADIQMVEGAALLAVAVRIGRTRLIDNVILGVEKA